MRKYVVGALLVVGLLAFEPREASADWLFTGSIAPIFGVSTKAQSGSGTSTEKYDGSVGFGLNVASAFPAVSNVGFEFDFANQLNGLKYSQFTENAFASRFATFSTNVFFSPATPHVRPYFSAGPTFVFRQTIQEVAEFDRPSSSGVGMNIGGGAFAFVTPRFGGRVDLRYFRNFGDMLDLTDISAGGKGYNNLQFMRLAFGATLVF